MSDIVQFLAMPFDLTDRGLVAGEPFKCASPGAAIERAKGYWNTLGHAGAVAFVRFDYPVTRTTLLRRFGNVPGVPVESAPED
ncbi:hypothetical protein [Bradyrhizobium sp.]|uniref:hypothetical protein n=1 Tax=Bradyrhizobium sp. TaxID=376 RepID=UPI0026071E23|nr:hypothetical protein [Bradyrhizobium sp.]